MASESKVYVQLGPRRWELGGEHLKLLEPCNQCLEAEDVGLALRNELNEKGYIYLKQVLPEELVLKAKIAGRVAVRIVSIIRRKPMRHLYFSAGNTFSICMIQVLSNNQSLLLHRRKEF